MIHDLLEGFSSNPGDGMPLRSAMICYGYQLDDVDNRGRSILDRYNVLNLRLRVPETHAFALQPAEMREILGYQRRFLTVLVDRLRTDEIVARGYTALGQLQRTLVPADWWTRVQIDLDGNSAEASGTRFLDVLVFPGEVTVREDKPLPEQVSTFATYSREAMSAWFVLRERSWPPTAQFPSEPTDLEAAQAYFGEGSFSRDEFRQVRQVKTSKEWRKPGRPRSR